MTHIRSAVLIRCNISTDEWGGERMKIDGVFAGGGVKALSFVGALEVLERHGFRFERTAGTSAGAVVATLIQANYTSRELKEIGMSLESSDIMNETWLNTYLPWVAWFSVYWRLGLYKGDVFERWIKGLLQRKNIYSFADIKKGSLKIVASDITEGSIIVFPDDLPKYGYTEETFPIAKAVTMSCMIPYFFQPVKFCHFQKKKEPHLVVDGGLLSNFPMWLFKGHQKKKEKRPILGFQLTPSIFEQEKKKIKNALDLYQSLFHTMRNAYDLRYISKYHAKDIVFLPVDQVKTTSFDLSQKDRELLIQIGKTYTEDFLKEWTY